MRNTGQPLNFELFCLFVHEELLRNTDDYDGLMEAFQVFDTDGDGKISSLEQDNVSKRLLLPNPEESIAMYMELQKKFEEG